MPSGHVFLRLVEPFRALPTMFVPVFCLSRFHLPASLGSTGIYGLVVHFRLLPTPPLGDAVTIGYGMPEHPDKDFHPAVSIQLQAH